MYKATSKSSFSHLNCLNWGEIKLNWSTKSVAHFSSRNSSNKISSLPHSRNELIVSSRSFLKAQLFRKIFGNADRMRGMLLQVLKQMWIQWVWVKEGNCREISFYPGQWDTNLAQPLKFMSHQETGIPSFPSLEFPLHIQEKKAFVWVHIV